MKAGILSSEFWTMIVTAVAGIGVMSGVVEPTAKDAIVQSVNTIVGAVVTIIPVVSYICGRSWLKAKTAEDLKKN